MTTMLGVDEQLAVLGRGAEAVYSPHDLRRKLAAGRPLRIKLGLDPTAPDIHLGHTVVLRKMRQFQDLGHRAVLIIGDYTARIGDPSGRDTTRPVLTDEQIEANARTYLDQAAAILDTSADRFELRRNSQWLSGLRLADLLQLTGHFTVQQMLHRDSFRQRIAAQREIQLSEFIYPLMQAYDSVTIKADVELGGTDQTFNNLRGRDLMARTGLDPQVVLIMPILVGLDGHDKMSKTRGNYISVTDPPDEMFGKVMSIGDDLMADYLHLLTPLPEDRIRSLVDPAVTHPRQAKDVLGQALVEQFYGAQAAARASVRFRRQFTQRKLPEDLQVRPVPAGQHVLAHLITDVGFAPSHAEAKRLIRQGAAAFDGRRIDDPAATVTVPPDRQVLLKVGKRRLCKLAASG